MFGPGIDGLVLNKLPGSDACIVHMHLQETAESLEPAREVAGCPDVRILDRAFTRLAWLLAWGEGIFRPR